MSRRIKPLSGAVARGLVFNQEIGDPPEIRWVDPSELLVDDRYQRDISRASRALMRRILAEFDWASFQLPNVIETAEGLQVTNGQHTAIICATHPGIGLIPVAVSRPRDLEGQAKSFLDINTNRTAVTRPQLHHSALAAGDPVSQHIQRIADAAGVRICKNQLAKDQWKPGDTIVIGTLRRLYDSRGPAKLRVMLELLNTRRPVGSLELLALDTLIHDPDYRGHWDAEAARPILMASNDYERNEAEAIAATHMKPQYAALAMVWFRRMPRRAAPPVLRRAS